MPSVNGERIFISGGTGFIGANLVRWGLKQGAEVYTNIRKTSDTWRIDEVKDEISLLQIDLSEKEKLTGIIQKIRPHYIFHTAVYGGDSAQKDWNTIFQSNVTGTYNLLKSCEKIPFNLFINTGSSSEYGLKQTPMKENDVLEPVTDYGISKATATMICRSMAYNSNLPIMTLRLFSPYGWYEQDSRLIPSVILAALRDQSPIISSRHFVRDFIFIRDVLNAYESTVDIQNPSGKILNIGSGKQHTVGEVADTVLKLLGNKVSLLRGKQQIWKNEPQFWEADITEAKSELNWKPDYTLEKGLKATIEWFRSNISLYE